MAIKMKTYEFVLRLLRPQLGTNPLDPDILGTHIIEKERKNIQEKSKVNAALNKYADASDISEERKAAEIKKIKEKAEELKEEVGELEERGITVFFREDDKVAIGDHMIYGFMKAAAEAISRTLPTKKGVMLHSAAYTESIINQHVRCQEEFLTYDRDILRKSDGSINHKVRSIRVVTAQGPRVSIIKSEQIPAGASVTFRLNVLDGSPLTEEILRKLFDYGEICGLGQWRNAGYGTFTYTMKEVK